MKTTFMLTAVLVLCLGGLAFAGSIYTPVSHWTFDETSGTTAHDSADGHNGTVNSAIWTTGKVDGALQFDGVSDYVNYGDINEFEFGGDDFTVSFWFYTNGVHDTGPGNDGKNNAAIVTKYNWQTGRQWFIGQAADGKINYATYHTSSSANYCFSSDSYFNEWVHVTCTKEGVQMYLYINGNLNDSGPSLGTTTGKSTNVIVGAIQDSSTHYYQRFNGLIDDVRIYDYALNAGEVSQLYQIPEPATICLFGLAGLFIGRKK